MNQTLSRIHKPLTTIETIKSAVNILDVFVKTVPGDLIQHINILDKFYK